LADPNEWTRVIEDVLAAGAGTRPSNETRARIRARYTWHAQAEIIGNECLRKMTAR
jgi:hypothetical protein